MREGPTHELQAARRRARLRPAPAEELLIGCLRAWAAARREGRVPHREVAGALGAQTSPRAASLFVAWIQSVEAASLRPIEIDCPDCGGIAPDLQRLVVSCGIAPVAFETGEELLAPLVSDPQSVMVLARGLNAALAQSGWPLPARLHARSDPPTAAGHTLH